MAFGVDLLEVLFSFIQFGFGETLHAVFQNLFWLFGVLAFIVFLFPKEPSWKSLLIEKIFFWGGNMYALVLFFSLLQIPLPFAGYIFLLSLLIDIFLINTKIYKHGLTITIGVLVSLSVIIAYL